MQNPRQGNVPAIYADRVGNAEIQFCLATQTIDGLPTTGIRRVHLEGYEFYTGSSSDIAQVAGSWDPNHYLNIWVVKFNNDSYRGYHSTAETFDGIAMNYKAFGSHSKNMNCCKLGSVLTHEVGHALGLLHLDEPDDFVFDTPRHSGFMDGCPSMEANGFGEMTMPMNFITSVDNDCQYMFTKGQVARMRSFAANDTLTSSVGCQTPAVYCSDWVITEDVNYLGAFQGPQMYRRTNVIVEQGVNLTIQDATLPICEGGKIELKQGATLTLLNSKVVGYEGAQYQGIEAVEGFATVALVDGGHIEGADTGIKIMNSGSLYINGYSPFYGGSGVRDCGIGIQLTGTASVEQYISDYAWIADCDIGISLQNSRNLKIENHVEFFQNRIGVRSVNSSFSAKDGCSFDYGDIGVQAVGTFPLGSGVLIGDPLDAAVTFAHQNIAAINSMYSWSPLGITVMNTDIENVPIATFLQGGDNFKYRNNSISNVENGFISSASANSLSQVRCNTFENASNASTSFVWSNAGVTVFQNEFSGTQNANIGAAGAIMAPQVGPSGGTASNCFSGDTEDILTMAWLGSTQQFEYKYFAPPTSDCDHVPNVTGDYLPVSTSDPQLLRDYCDGSVGIFNLVDPTGGSNPNFDPTTITPTAVDPSNPVDPTGPPVQYPPTSTNPQVNPPVICLPCLDEVIDDAIADVVLAGGDNPLTEQDESSGNNGYEEEEAIMQEWIDFGLYISLQANDLSIGQNLLSQFKGWDWSAKRVGLFMIAQEYIQAESLINSMIPSGVEESQLKQILEVSLKVERGQNITTADMSLLQTAGSDKYAARGVARALYFVVTGTELSSVLPVYSKSTLPRSSEMSRVLLYPNPTKDIVQLSLTKNEIESISIQSVTGAVVYEMENIKESNLSIDVSHLNDGVYFVLIEDSAGKEYFDKLIVHQ